MNPYESPKVDSGAPPVAGGSEKSVALRVSVGLAIVGFVGLWGAATFYNAVLGARSHGGGVALGVIGIGAVVAHLVGVGVTFAASPGRRWIGGLANGVSLLILVAVFALGISHAKK